MFEPETVLQERYRLLRTLSEGERSVLYEAQDQQLDRRVAIKAWPGVDAGQQEALAAAVQAHQRLYHPALPELWDWFVQDDTFLAVMSWLPGETLADWREQREALSQAEQREVVAWGEQMLEALGYLHSRQPALVHGDIKPSNVRRSANGLALADLDVPLGQAGQQAGAFSPYRAPEYLFTGAPTPRSDLYNVGATLYFLLTGVEPPDARARTDAWRGRQPDPLRPLDELNPQVPPALAAAIASAMAVNPAHRPRSAAALRAELREATFAPAPPSIAEEPPSFLEEPVGATKSVEWEEPAASTPIVEERPVGEPVDHPEPLPPTEPLAPPKQGSRARSCLWVALGAGVVIFICAPCLLIALLTALGPSIGDMFGAAAEPTAVVVPAEGQPVSVFELAEGYCFNDPVEGSGGTVGELLVVPCDQPHDNEVFALFQYPAEEGAPFPAQEVMDQYADEQCNERFGAYVGIPYNESELYYWPISPTSDTWAEGDREIICSLYDGQGQALRGSMRGSQR